MTTPVQFGTRELVLRTTTRTGHSVGALISAWLAQFTDSEDTRSAYGRDLAAYIAWCTERHLDPLTVRLPEVQMYAAALADAASPHTGRPYSPRTRARKLASVSSWYTFLVRAGALDANPAHDVKRPRYDRKHSTTSSLNLTQAAEVKTAADADEKPRGRVPLIDPLCAVVVLSLLIDLGVRVSEVCGINLTDLGQRDHTPTVVVRMKGGKTRTRALPDVTSRAIEAYRSHRPSPADEDARAALLLTRDGYRITRHQVFGLVQRKAREAGIPFAGKITPHSMRHTFNTIARVLKVPLEDRRDALGHSSAAITQLYDHVALSIERDPSFKVAAATSAITPQENQQ